MELAGYFGVIGRWWATLLISTWVAGLAGYFIASGIAPTYEGVTRLLVGPVVADVDVTRAAGALAYTYSELTTTEPALEEARQTLGLPSDTEIVARAIPNETTRILAIRAEHSSPESAAAIANTLATILQGKATSDVSLPEGQLSVIEEAVPDPVPIAPQVTLIAVVAAATGLVASIVLVVLVEYFGTTVNSQRELAELTRVPVLATAGLGRGFRPSRGQPTIVEARPRSRAAAALRTVATKVAYAGADRKPSSVLIVGTAQRDAAPDLALGIASVMARSGRRVVVVDGDDQTAALTGLLALHERRGLTDVLLDTSLDPGELVISRPNSPAVLPYGQADGVDLLPPERAQEVIRRLQETHDAVIIAAAPIQYSGHALVWAQQVTSVIVGVERERAKRDDVTYTMENLNMAGAPILGTVFLGRAPRPRGGSRPSRTGPSPAERAMAMPQVEDSSTSRPRRSGGSG